MLPEPNRLHHHVDFSRTVRRGRRAGRSDIVVHACAREADVVHGGPRFGLIVAKSVGPAVTRHRVARRLRHACRPLVGSLNSDIDVVIRALPSAAAASVDDLERQITGCLQKMRLLDR